MSYYQRIYQIEDEAKDMSAEERHEYRQKMTVTVWTAFKQWALEHEGTVPPKNLLIA